MYSPQNYIEKPINLLSFDSTGHALLNPQAIQYLQSIPKPISIMSIAGPYRTGKSYLLNSIISGEERFPVSSTTSSCTKGLWVWGKPLLSVDQLGKITNVLVIDTEGFGCIDEVYDKRIIILALLLSTCFIYNSKGNIDRSSLQDLQYVIEQTKKIKREVAFDSVTDFHWVLRDFHFQLVNQLELQIPSNQYMEKCLKQFADQNNQQKQAYKLFCNFFRNRHCHTFISPQTNPTLQQNPQFLQQLIKFKKILNGIPSLDLEGHVLSQIMKAYVAAMNQDLGVERQGTQCRLRLNCISQLNYQLEAIREEEQSEIREKKIKMALNEVEDNYIAKMTSQKQIKILKDDINLLISEYEQSNPSTLTKHIKNKQLKPSICIIRPKQIKIPTQMQTNQGELSIKNALKAQLVSSQRARQQLQGKIYRYQLTNKQLSQDITKLSQQNTILQQQTRALQQKILDFQNTLLSNDKAHQLQIIQLTQHLQSIKKQKLLSCSTLQKQNQLLLEKIQFLEERFACRELSDMETTSGRRSRYAEKIYYLEQENAEMDQKHRKQIQELRDIYLRKDQLEEVSQKQLTSYRKIAMGEQIKGYLQSISKLQEENSKLIIEKTQLENEKYSLQSMYGQLKASSTAEIQCFQKQLRENKANLSQMHASQIQLKNIIIKEYENKLEEQTKLLKTELEALAKKSEEQSNEANETIAGLEEQLDRAEEQILSTCEQLQISENKRLEKQNEVKELIEKNQQLLTFYNSDNIINNTHNYQNFDSANQLQPQLDELKCKVEALTKENNQLSQTQQQIRKQLYEQREQYNQYSQQRKSIYDIQIARLEQKIAILTNTNINLKQIHRQYEQLKTIVEQGEQQKKYLTDTIEDKDRNIRTMQNEHKNIKQQNRKLEKIIVQLTNSITMNQLQVLQLSDKNMQKLQLKQLKYLQILSKYHEKQKKCEILKQHYQASQKCQQDKEKQFKKQITQKLQDKNRQVVQLRKQLQQQNYQSNQYKVQALKNKQQLQLSNQKFILIQEGYQRQVEETKADCQSSIQKINIKINNLQQQIKKLQDNKLENQKTLLMYQNDARETVSTITLMRTKYDKHCQQYEVNIKMMRRRIAQLERQNIQLMSKVQKYEHELQYVHKNKELLENNYNQDFKLWSNKIQTFQQMRPISR